MENVLNPFSKSSHLHNFYSDNLFVACRLPSFNSSTIMVPSEKNLLDLFSTLWKVNVDITSVIAVFITI